MEETENKSTTELETADVTAEEKERENENENTPEKEEKAINLQAARYAYIGNLESKILADDESVSENDLMDVCNCKSQILVELVSVANYAEHLPADSPHKKASEVLTKHLYKCYEKIERVQERVRRAREKSKYMADVKQVGFEELPRRQASQNIITDEQLMPNRNVINLTGIGLTTGYIAMLSQLISNPVESIKAQMPNLIEELQKRLTGDDKIASDNYIGKLLTEMTGLKTEKAMTNALENSNLTAHIMSMVGGKSI